MDKEIECSLIRSYVDFNKLKDIIVLYLAWIQEGKEPMILEECFFDKDLDFYLDSFHKELRKLINERKEVKDEH